MTVLPDDLKETVAESVEELKDKNLRHRVNAIGRGLSEAHDNNTLTAHQQTLYKIIEGYDEISPSDLYEEYQSRMEDPKTNRTVQNYLAKMDQYDVIQAEGRAEIERTAWFRNRLEMPQNNRVRLDFWL